MVQLTREEIEKGLEEKYLGKMVAVQMPEYDVFGIIIKIAVEEHEKEPMVCFTMLDTLYKVDVNYFIENTIINGNPSRGSAGDTGV